VLTAGGGPGAAAPPPAPCFTPPPSAPPSTAWATARGATATPAPHIFAAAVAASSLQPGVPSLPAAAPAADVDMDAAPLWAFAGGGVLYCPGGPACRREGRHEDWLLSCGAGGELTYLPVLHDSDEAGDASQRQQTSIDTL
jgi:hypothetical protein